MSFTIDEKFAQLEQFDTAAWRNWIEYFLLDLACQPEIVRAHDPHHLVLNSIWDQLSRPAQLNFEDAVVDLTASIDPAPDEVTRRRIFNLLQVLPHSRPPAAKNTLRKWSKTDILRGYSYRGWDLRGLLISVLGSYDIAGEMANDIISRAVQSGELHFVGTSMRALAGAGAQAPFNLIRTALDLVESDDDRDYLTEILAEIISLAGFDNVIRWCLRVLPALEFSRQKNVDLLVEILRSLAPWPARNGSDEWAILLGAYLHAGRHRFAAVELGYIAAISERDLELPASRDGEAVPIERVVIEVLTLIWNRSRQMWPGKLPWFSKEEGPNRFRYRFTTTTESRQDEFTVEKKLGKRTWNALLTASGDRGRDDDEPSFDSPAAELKSRYI